MQFRLISENKPTGDQPQAIEQLVRGLNEGSNEQVLLGITGSGNAVVVQSDARQSEKKLWPVSWVIRTR
jgi:excinuclease ABC subunit B